ncbi:SusD/RagB family nutrient-binding outer membrane lipoprotein [Mucilaginibacter sp. KACC 22063]|uniref:SusD/RagB family nutrient-binding outer membrane lipoprotein n=1 Tax=Mucilaginibacter sp. KACC 22063 TaxID=3025666 RepID=UPI002366825B|nr:SusD/RagB family nutrient-binding outer membrane lipoprotein [Mucilaginibacter sp. KACC 22063]WDF57428.1 SusD/RagB family nutrient-binding outer membrane lipoprotein [Mucilaginibacter sp. KACC 22063]
MKKLYILIAIGCLTGFTGCKKYIDVNQDPNRPTSVQEALILAPVELEISTSVMGSGGVSSTIQEYMQVMALNQVAPNSGTYLMYNGDMDGDWGNIYVGCLNNLVNLTKMAQADGKTNYSGISKILTAYCLATATDLWGDIPYSQAFQGTTNLTPAYDTQQSIYTQVQSLLDAGIADINKKSTIVPGNDDYYYSGNMSKWLKLAYTLKARYYMHLANAPGTTPAAQAQLALTALNNGMASNDDDFKMPYTGTAGTENPWQQNFLPVSTFVLGDTFVNGLQQRNDPRLSKMVAPAVQTGLYTGRQNGLTAIGSLEAYSIPADFYAGAGAYNYLVNYSEALFLKAEATYYISGYATAAPYYVAGVKSHMTKLGVSDADAATYLASRTLSSTNGLQLIMEEKQIADFLLLENFNDWRRTGYPKLTKVLNALSDIPRRVLYPQVEITSNPQPAQSAKLTDRVWWDTK